MKNQQLLMATVLGISLLLSACERQSYRERFFAGRPCQPIQFKCLNESQREGDDTITIPENRYQLTLQDMDSIEQRRTERMYAEITQMLEIYYPNFWADKADKDMQMAWVAKVDEITRRYYPRRSRGDLEHAVLIYAIIGSDFEEKPEFDFIVERMQSDAGSNMSLFDIYNWLRFEVLKKDYGDDGTQYNNWSLRGADRGMPAFTRHVPDFDNEWLPDNPNENVWEIYKYTVREGGRENTKRPIE